VMALYVPRVIQNRRERPIVSRVTYDLWQEELRLEFLANMISPKRLCLELQLRKSCDRELVVKFKIFGKWRRFLTGDLQQSLIVKADKHIKSHGGYSY
jgi:hypothetical protein